MVLKATGFGAERVQQQALLRASAGVGKEWSQA